MSDPFSDDELRRRLAELGRRESSSAPSLSRLLRPRAARTRVALLRPAVALAGILLLAAAVSWWPRSAPHTPMAFQAAATPFPAAAGSWEELPTDELLSDVGTVPETEAARLSREIEGLLEP